ncbi:MAG: (Fe-S)-binding protein [Candidatus Thorarchaeota archaeon]|nr:MAG: (Fe-S)-binding protein [Candidatus Thorarchaeota archaeon]
MIFDDSLAEQIRMCAACPKMCRHVCPTFFAWRSDSPTPHGRALLLHQEIVGTRDLDERGIEVLFQCLECSHCLTFCKPEIDIAAIVEHRRNEIVDEGRRPSGLNELAESIEKHHNPYSEPHGSRNDWVETKNSDGKRLFYFTGCTAAYREKEIASDTVELLETLGNQVSVSPDEWCCGSPLFRTGDVTLGLEQANHNVEMLNAIDADEIVVTCPGCYRVLTKDYVDYDLKLNKPVKHISQKLEEQIHKLPLGEFGNSITYHDPCHLGRHCGIYDEPRRVIEKVSGVSLVEMERTRENAMCCGNGAGLRTLFPEKAKMIGSERVKHAKIVGAGILVTSCPFCKNMLESQSGEDLTVLDLPEIVLMAMRGRKVNID